MPNPADGLYVDDGAHVSYGETDEDYLNVGNIGGSMQESIEEALTQDNNNVSTVGNLPLSIIRTRYARCSLYMKTKLLKLFACFLNLFKLCGCKCNYKEKIDKYLGQSADKIDHENRHQQNIGMNELLKVDNTDNLYVYDGVQRKIGRRKLRKGDRILVEGKESNEHKIESFTTWFKEEANQNTFDKELWTNRAAYFGRIQDLELLSWWARKIPCYCAGKQIREASDVAKQARIKLLTETVQLGKQQDVKGQHKELYKWESNSPSIALNSVMTQSTLDTLFGTFYKKATEKHVFNQDKKRSKALKEWVENNEISNFAQFVERVNLKELDLDENNNWDTEVKKKIDKFRKKSYDDDRQDSDWGEIWVKMFNTWAKRNRNWTDNGNLEIKLNQYFRTLDFVLEKTDLGRAHRPWMNGHRKVYEYIEEKKAFHDNDGGDSKKFKLYAWLWSLSKCQNEKDVRKTFEDDLEEKTFDIKEFNELLGQVKKYKWFEFHMMYKVHEMASLDGFRRALKHNLKSRKSEKISITKVAEDMKHAIVQFSGKNGDADDDAHRKTYRHIISETMTTLFDPLRRFEITKAFDRSGCWKDELADWKAKEMMKPLTVLINGFNISFDRCCLGDGCFSALPWPVRWIIGSIPNPLPDPVASVKEYVEKHLGEINDKNRQRVIRSLIQQLKEQEKTGKFEERPEVLKRVLANLEQMKRRSIRRTLASAVRRLAPGLWNYDFVGGFRKWFKRLGVSFVVICVVVAWILFYVWIYAPLAGGIKAVKVSSDIAAKFAYFGINIGGTVIEGALKAVVQFVWDLFPNRAKQETSKEFQRCVSLGLITTALLIFSMSYWALLVARRQRLGKRSLRSLEIIELGSLV